VIGLGLAEERDAGEGEVIVQARRSS
jgi:hypothetical protein